MAAAAEEENKEIRRLKIRFAADVPTIRDVMAKEAKPAAAATAEAAAAATAATTTTAVTEEDVSEEVS